MTSPRLPHPSPLAFVAWGLVLASALPHSSPAHGVHSSSCAMSLWCVICSCDSRDGPSHALSSLHPSPRACLVALTLAYWRVHFPICPHTCFPTGGVLNGSCGLPLLPPPLLHVCLCAVGPAMVIDPLAGEWRLMDESLEAGALSVLCALSHAPLTYVLSCSRHHPRTSWPCLWLLSLYVFAHPRSSCPLAGVGGGAGGGECGRPCAACV